MQITDKIRFKSSGASYTVDEFAAKYGNNDIKTAMDAMAILVKRGDATILGDHNTKEQQVVKKAASQQETIEQAESFDKEDELIKDRRQQLKREGKATYPKIEVEYLTTYKALEAQKMYETDLRLNNIELVVRKGIPYLVFFDITDKDLDYINRTYKTERLLSNTMNTITAGSTKVTDGLDYTAKKIATPIFEIGAKTSISILRSAVGMVVKTGATIVTATSKGVKDTCNDIKTDSDVIRAKRELIETSSSIKCGIANKTGSNASGITIIN